MSLLESKLNWQHFIGCMDEDNETPCAYVNGVGAVINNRNVVSSAGDMRIRSTLNTDLCKKQHVEGMGVPAMGCAVSLTLQREDLYCLKFSNHLLWRQYSGMTHILL